MATRIYLPSTGAPDVSPSYDAAWEHTSDADRRKAVTTKINSAMADKVVNKPASDINQQDILARQWVSGSLDVDQTIAGTVKGQMRALEAAAALNARAQILIRVVSNDGATTRGTLLAHDTGGTSSSTSPHTEFATTMTNRRNPPTGSATLTSVAALAGDRIVIAIGYRVHSTVTGTSSATFRFGDASGTDLAEDETSTTDNNPWVEFSQTITFSTGTTLTVADGAHAHTADAPVLTQVHSLVLTDAAHGHTADAPSLGQVHVLTAADATHGHSADNADLNVAGSLSVADGQHAHGADSPSLTQVHQLTVADGLHDHSADAPSLAQVHAITVAPAQHAHTATDLALSQVHQLVVADGNHGHTADSPTLTGGGLTLVVGNGNHGHTAVSLSLAQVHVLVTAGGLHSHAAESPTVTPPAVPGTRRRRTAATARRLSVATQRRSA